MTTGLGGFLWVLGTMVRGIFYVAAWAICAAIVVVYGQKVETSTGFDAVFNGFVWGIGIGVVLLLTLFLGLLVRLADHKDATVRPVKE